MAGKYVIELRARIVLEIELEEERGVFDRGGLLDAVKGWGGRGPYPRELELTPLDRNAGIQKAEVYLSDPGTKVRVLHEPGQAGGIH